MYADGPTQATPAQPSINLVGFMEQAVERLTRLRNMLKYTSKQLTGANPEEISKAPQRPNASCVAHHLEDTYRLLNEVEYLAQQIEAAVGQSATQPAGNAAGLMAARTGA